jgi:hypothetical protein
MFNLCNLITMSRLSIEIDPESHRQIKTLATFAGMTIKDYILSKTLPGKEQAADATEQLLKSPKNAARLRDAISTPQPDHVAFESLDELKDALGI